MPDLRTELTEIITGLAMLPGDDLEASLQSRPESLHNVEARHWDRLHEAYRDGAYRREFERAWQNGKAFLAATDGLRGRSPVRIEWKGPHRSLGDERVPADLRVDHVYLVSCKYLSDILHNPSPPNLFDRGLSDRRRHGQVDWFFEMAPREYQRLYDCVRTEALPADVLCLNRDHREMLKNHLQKWPAGAESAYREFCAAVGEASASRWRRCVQSIGGETMLWRLLRLCGSPYFVLGHSGREVLRLRIYTPWDWRQHYDLQDFTVRGRDGAGQPRVEWHAAVRYRSTGDETQVAGHVEIRWSHGRFCGHPEAKVYLDTPHTQVPGYAALA